VGGSVGVLGGGTVP